MDHFLPIRHADLLTALEAGAPAGFRPSVALADRLLAQESALRVERLKALHGPHDPTSDLKPRPGSSVPAGDLDQELAELMARANYQVLGEEGLKRAMAEESVFQVKLHCPLDDFRTLTIYTRGPRQRQEVIRSWFGLRKRTITVDLFERVLLLVRFQDASHFPEKRRARLAFEPGTLHLKLFANVPAADLEMILPNSEIRMKLKDQLLIGVPALVGIIGMAAKLAVVFGFLWAAMRWAGHQAGVHSAPDADPSLLAAQAGVVIGAAVALYLFINRQLMRYRFTKMKFFKTLADSLYTRSLDNHAGAFHRVADEALEEECKEVAAAWRLLLDGPASEAELDARVEHWFKQTLDLTVDFEVDDALAKLERLGLARRDGERWTALSPTEGHGALRQRWAALAG